MERIPIGSHCECAEMRRFLLVDPPGDGRAHQLRDQPAAGEPADVHGVGGRNGQVLGHGVRGLLARLQGPQGQCHQHEIQERIP